MAVNTKHARKLARRPARKLARTVAGKVAATPRVPVRDAIELTDEQIALLCLKTLFCLRTIEYYAAGFSMHRTTKLRIEQEMEKAGIKRRVRTPGQGRRRRVVAGGAEGKAA